MVYDIFPASEKLKNIVNHYVVISSLEGIENLLFLPNGCNFIVFNRGVDGYLQSYKDERRVMIPKNYSVSIKSNKVKKIVLEDTSIQINYPIILVELTPIGYYKLFKKNSFKLKSNYEELDESIAKEYFSELYKHKNVKEELSYLDKSLNALKSLHQDESLLVYDMVYSIQEQYMFELSVEDLIKEYKCSRSTIEREFKKVIGLTPKNFIFVAKFCKTFLSYIGYKHTFKELEYLYSDSSHMNAVFKKFLGIGPSAALKEVTENNLQVYQLQIHYSQRVEHE